MKIVSSLRAARGVLLLALGLPWSSAQAQRQSSLYAPSSVRRAIARGTRSPDGRPGPRYWQNHARYTISVTALPPDRTIRGREDIRYVNESPDTLKRLVFKLLLNIHKPGAPRLGGTVDAYLTSGVHIDAFAVNGQTTPWPKGDGYFTWMPVTLAAPLMPHDSVRLAFDWHYDVSVLSGREGALDSTSFFLAYFYPRVSVYDDVNGWDREDFNDALEFYSDFNDYDVTVNVPAGYVVWGTGTLLEPQTVLAPATLQRFQASLSADTTIHVASAAEMAARRVTTTPQGSTNAWRFRARNVPDMAFALSDHYVWDAASVVVDPASGRRAGVQAAYNDTASDYRHMVRYGRHALDWLSRRWPGVPYPYEKTTVVEGLAGMEYPMMANDESYPDTVFSRFVAEHEIAHTYFPFYMGTNETRYGFMDEGWATTFEHLLAQEDMGRERAVAFFKEFRVAGWASTLSDDADQPIITPFAVGNSGYGKPALGYLALKEFLGDSLFRVALHSYMDRWHGKHPIPWDFFNSFSDATGRNLDWFWRSWFVEPGHIDLAVRDVRRSGRGWTVALENVGGMPAPVDLQLTFADGSTRVVHEPSTIWQASPRLTSVIVPGTGTLRAVALEHGIWMDADTTNDRWTAPGARGAR